MIQTGFDSRVKVYQVIENQLPSFILDENPKASEFLKQYYISQEYQSGPVDIAENLDQYLKLDNLRPEVIVDSTFLTSGIGTDNKITINVNSTKGFPKQYGLLKIDNEIITYTGITTNSFLNCQRGFSGITSYHQDLNQEELLFETSKSTSHEESTLVENLSSLFLKEFYKKLKYSFAPGFEDLDFTSELNAGNFIKEARSFYRAKGTDEAFKILFKVLYGVDATVVNLEDFLIKPSSANFVRRQVVLIESLSGEPNRLVGQTIEKIADPTTNASVSEVEIFTRGGKKYYKMSFFVGHDDFPTVQGKFTVTPSTKCLETVSIGSSIISVDSTIGFATSGTIICGINSITYTSKSINQFFGCSGITSEIEETSDIRTNDIYFGYENGDTTKKVEFKILGSLSDFVQISENLNGINEGDKIYIKSLGNPIRKTKFGVKTFKEVLVNSWIYNTNSRYQIENFSGPKTLNLKSSVDKTSLKHGDEIEIVERGTLNVVFTTYIDEEIEIESKSIKLFGFDFNPDPDVKYDLRRKINKCSSLNVPIVGGDNNIISDVSNLYTDNDYAYVASNSLPSDNRGLSIPHNYQITKTLNRSYIDNTTGVLTEAVDNEYTVIGFSDDAPFLTGDKIYYEPLEAPLVGLETGAYYVEVLESNKKRIRLYSSQSFVGGINCLTFVSPSNSGIGTHIFTLYSQRSGKLGPQKILRKFPFVNNIENGTNQKTLPGSVGILVNGVEIDSYKSYDKIYYGPLKSVNILNGGVDYDVINPPVITVSSGVGTTASIHPVVSGSIKKVYVENQNFDIQSVVSIGISGGNGSGAILEPVIKKRVRNIFFDARPTTSGGGINTTTGQLTFLTKHNFIDGDKIVYNSNGNASIGVGIGTSTLANNSSYYVKTTSDVTVRLHQSFSDYSSGINTVGFSTINTFGIHKFYTSSEKNTLTELKVINGGKNYTNRKLIVKPIGISTYNHTINFVNHGFNDGDLIKYEYELTSISGVSTNPSNEFYVLKIDDDSFRISDAGIGGTIRSNYERKNYIKFSSIGSGYQYFKYPEIVVSVKFTTPGVSTSQTIEITPKVSGKIIDAYLYEPGTGYGSSILNFEKKPLITIKNGKDAKLVPNIINGTLTSVSIEYSGKEYYSAPDLILEDPTNSGIGAELVPTISGGKITSVSIINSGIGYSTSSKIKVVSAGSNSIIDVSIRDLTVNKTERFDSEIYDETLNNNLKYSVSGYFETLKNSFVDDGTFHSNLIGWAYDGNPIYGSYGYSSPDDSSSVRLLTSSYVLDTSYPDRPTFFDPGFFIEDYRYNESGDLDIHNGRFCKTPDFPNGVYAYFSPVDSINFQPVFPYFIGDTYRSNVLNDNFSLDQSFDFKKSNLLRNTFPYKLSELDVENDFLPSYSDLKNQILTIESTSSGIVDGFDIISAGLNYKINDSLEFKDSNDTGLSAKISSLEGKEIVNLTGSTETYNNVIVSWKDSNQIKVTVLPYHNLNDQDYVTLSGFSTIFTQLNDFYKIGVSSEFTTIVKNIPQSASIGSTEIYVSSIPNSLSVGSSIGIGTETLKVLNIFKGDNILRVHRSLTGVGSSHTASSIVSILPNSFTIDKNLDYFDSKVNDKINFNPRESVGVGTTVGTSNLITFNFGDSTVSRDVPIKGIYLENHPFITNQKIILTIPSGNISVSTDGSSTYLIPLSGTSEELYVVNKNNNVIGLKTSFTGEELFFHTNGDDNDEYSIESTFNQFKGTVERYKTTVSISTAHELTSGDNITLNIKPNLNVGIGTSSSIIIKKDSINDYILVNPIGFNSTGINTTTSEITLPNHNLKTGDKIKYSANTVASGLSTSFYYVYKIDDNKIKVCETYADSINKNIANTISIASTGGSSQTISLINPEIKVTRNNNLVFDLSDPSLINYQLKIYYDQGFKNEFVSTGSTTEFSISGVGTAGITTGASLTINYSDNLPSKLFYNLKKSGYISTADSDVVNFSQITFVDSIYNKEYKISGVGTTTFNVYLQQKPEKTSYVPTECQQFEYFTDSATASGPIHRVSIISNGSNSKTIPIVKQILTDNGLNGNILCTSNNTGDIKDLNIINIGFEYPSDPTLQPTAYISPQILTKDSNTIGVVTVTDGGSEYVNPPLIAIVDSTTGEVIDSGILEAKLSGNSVSSVKVVQSPKGLPDSGVNLFAVNNTNGFSIQQIQSSSTGIFTCFISKPTLGFSPDPFAAGDQVFIEGVQKESIDGDGFNSEDYGYEFFNVSSFDDTTGILAKIVINVSGLTTNTGIAKTIQDFIPSIINKKTYPIFEFSTNKASFIIGEKIISDETERDLTILDYNDSFVKVYGTYELSKGEVFKGKESGTISTVEDIRENLGKFNVDFSVNKNIGWSDNIGLLNNDNQVIPDNDYYQNLSYTIKSPITYNEFKTPVNNLLHPVGMKNFSDTGITSSLSIGINSENITTIVRDFVEEHRVDTIYNFDLSKDIDIVGSSSKFIKLENKVLTPFIDNITNNVLKLDNINRLFSNLETSPDNFLNLIDLEEQNNSYLGILVRVTSSDNTEIQLSDLVILNDGTNTSLFEKGTLVNSGIGLTPSSTEKIGDFAIEKTELDEIYLRFIPTDPYVTDYDIKWIQSSFESNSVGLASTSIGFVKLYNSIKRSAPGITTNIISVDATLFPSLHASVEVKNDSTNEINFVELYLTQDGSNTYISEYYVDNSTSESYSGNFIGSFGANLSSNVLSLNFTNTLTSNNVTVKSSIVGFGTTSVVGISSIYRFRKNEPAGFERSAVYTTNYNTTTSGLSTTILDINLNLFNSVKSLVEVSMGSTKALHQVIMIHDGVDVYTAQMQFLSVSGVTTSDSVLGLGTFGGAFENSGNNLVLKFYPDASVTQNLSISNLSKCLYQTVDVINTPPDLDYISNSETLGKESIKVSLYNSVNGERINRKDFPLTSGGLSVFAREFDPDDNTQINLSTGVFSSDNHFFSENEEITYTPKSTFSGIGATPMTYKSGSVVATLPSNVFIVNKTDNTFQISTTRAGTAVTFISAGSGNAHLFEMTKKNEKVILTIDDLIQYPLAFNKITHQLPTGIGTESTLFEMSGISTVFPKDILRIDNEYMGVVNTGFGTTSVGPISGVGTAALVEVIRGFVGSSVTSHSAGSQIKIYKGAFNIVGNTLYLTDAPRGNPQLERDASNLEFQTSEFTGRVFLRNNYASNSVFDNITNEFNGIGRTFTLTVGGANTIGIGTTGGNGLVVINGMFQAPTTENNPNNNFKIIESVGPPGITSVVFSSVRPNVDIISEFDINQNEIPRGGIIVSLGSSSGLGYAPLVGASVTAVVGAGGSIVSVGLGTTDIVGSGYNGIVSIGVTVYEEGHIGVGSTAIITAVVGAGGSLSFTIGYGGTGYTNPKIFVSDPSYENLKVVGVSRIGIGSTTATGVGLLLNVEVGASSTTGIGSTYFEVSKFNISRQGYSFRRGDIFKPVGLVTDGRLSSPLSEFTLTVLDTFSDSFAAWQFGNLDYIDSIKNYQNGERRSFPLYYDGNLLSFEKSDESTVELQNLLVIFINGILQEPGSSYVFNGGTSFTFTTAPKAEDNISIFFYRGTIGDDSFLNLDVYPTIKSGDIVKVYKNNQYPTTITQDNRTVFNLTYSDKFETNLYSAQGIDDVLERPISWTKQKRDQKINGEFVFKSRDSLESAIYPTAKVIKNFSSSDTDIFVDDAQFFNYDNTVSPQPFDALIINGISTTPDNSVELVTNISSVYGFSGVVTGITTSVGIGTTLALKFYINNLSEDNLVGLTTGNPIYIYNTTIGNGVTSIDNSNSSVVGIGTTFLDNIYIVHSWSAVVGDDNLGIITCNVHSSSNIIGLSTSGTQLRPVGNFSWGKLTGFSRSNSPISIGVSGCQVDVGLTTFATIQRRGIGLKLKYETGALPKQL